MLRTMRRLSLRIAIAIAFAALVGDPRAAHAAEQCQAFYDATVPVPPGWGAAYDLFHAAHTALASVDCTVGTTPLSVGEPNDPTVYVYQTAYVLTSDMGATWTAVTLSASQPPSGGWLSVPATAPLNLTGPQLNADWNYLAFVYARWNGTRWLIGCADTTCATSAWSLQAITRQTTLTATISPVAPNISNDTAAGATIATVACVWSDGSPCTATFALSDAQGRYTLSGSNIIVDPMGPGVGAAGTADTISVTATQ